MERIPGWQYFNKDSVFISRLYEVGKRWFVGSQSSFGTLGNSLMRAVIRRKWPGITCDALHTNIPATKCISLRLPGHGPGYFDVFYKQVSCFWRWGCGGVISGRISDCGETTGFVVSGVDGRRKTRESNGEWRGTISSAGDVKSSLTDMILWIVHATQPRWGTFLWVIRWVHVSKQGNHVCSGRYE